MVNLFTQCDADYGKRVAEELKKTEKDRNGKMQVAINLAEEMAHPSDPY